MERNVHILKLINSYHYVFCIVFYHVIIIFTTCSYHIYVILTYPFLPLLSLSFSIRPEVITMYCVPVW